MKKIIKVSLLNVLCIVFMLSSFSVVWAAGSEFSLSPVQTSKGRLFSVSLECKADKEIGSFIAEIEYNADAVEYKSAKVTDKSAELSVNSTQEGLVRLVYLCEEGADCKSKTPLVQFTFKALQTGEHKISLGVRQVIDHRGADVEASGGDYAIVTVEDSAKRPDAQGSGADKKVDKDTNSSARAEDPTKIEESETDHGYVTLVDERNHDVPLIIASVSMVLTLVCLVGICAYKYGIKAANKSKGQTLDDISSVRTNEEQKK